MERGDLALQIDDDDDDDNNGRDSGNASEGTGGAEPLDLSCRSLYRERPVREPAFSASRYPVCGEGEDNFFASRGNY